MFWKVLFRKQTEEEGESCEHDWHELETRGELVDTLYSNFDYREIMYLYCPICDKRIREYEEDGRLILKANQIKKSYKKG